MRDNVLFLVVLFGLICWLIYGCTTVKESYDSLLACQSDPACNALMIQGRDLSSSVISSAVDSVPQVADFSGLIGAGVGGVVVILIGVFCGKRKRGV